MGRLTRIEYFMKMAEIVKERGTCGKLKVGCVLTTEDNRVVSVGYNSAPSGSPHCEDVGCLLSEEHNANHCIRTIHSEAGAVANLPKRYKTLICYVTHNPCINCYKILIAANVKKIYYKLDYISRDRDLFVKTLKDIKIEKV